MRRLSTIVVLLVLCTKVFSTTYFIATNGDDMNDGLSLDFPFATISQGFSVALAGDTLLLDTGIFHGTTVLEDKNGRPDQPIVLKSYATDPLDFAVIDGGSSPSQNVRQPGLYLKNCSWLVIENIIFRNCWRSVINVDDSAYIMVRSCHFSTGKEVVYPHGNEAHHILVENCYVRHPDEVWRGWSWESIHHGSYEFYNGGLLHPRASGGGHVMRGNVGYNLFNAFRTRPNKIQQDGNIEIYNNSFYNVRDNDFEPERWAWNIHYHHNWHRNVHKAFSIDDVRGGNIYIFGNTYTQGQDSYAREEVSGIFKYKDGPLTYPCFAFNNSFYTEARVLKEGEASNHQLKHFNNAYYFFSGSRRFRVDDWQDGYEFDYDLINQEFPDIITRNQQETNGLENADVQFIDGLQGDFRLQDYSPAVDAGKIMTLPEFDWVQRFVGEAPDIGAFEGSQPIDGPAFRFVPSPDGAYYEERPRISQHRVDSTRLILYFSTALDSTSLATDFMAIYQNGTPIQIDTFYFINPTFELLIETRHPLVTDSISLVFNSRPVGLNGLPLTDWASTVPIGIKIPTIYDLSVVETEIVSSVEGQEAKEETKLTVVPNPASERITFTLQWDRSTAQEALLIYNTAGILMGRYLPTQTEVDQVKYEIVPMFPKGIYFGVVHIGTDVVTKKFVVK
ncbi:MAG: T9SS type A sorting domain-containing protein [Bacteroidota bacterium]